MKALRLAVHDVPPNLFNYTNKFVSKYARKSQFLGNTARAGE